MPVPDVVAEVAVEVAALTGAAAALADWPDTAGLLSKDASAKPCAEAVRTGAGFAAAT